MKTVLLHWLLSAVALLIVSAVIPGIAVAGFGSALWAALIIGLVNATVGFFLKVVTLPLSILTFGLFLLVINALMLMLVDSMLSGFDVSGFVAAFFGAIVLAVVNAGLRALVGGK
jgi:putative membrane protein